MATPAACRRLPVEKGSSTSAVAWQLSQILQQLPMLLLLLFLLPGKQGVRSTRVGTCYSSMQPGDRCSGLLWSGVTQEQCCQLWADRPIFWSEKSTPLYYHLSRSGVPSCRPCHVSCDTMKCNAPKQCELGPTGLPRCACRQQCTESELSKAAAADQYSAEVVAALVAGEQVCSDDGKTYDNYCNLLYRNCHTGSHARVAYLGACRVYSCNNLTCAQNGQRCIVDQHNMPHCVQCLRQCRTNGSQPCCGSDGRTYASTCHLAQHNCLHGLSVVMQYSGECRARTVCDEETNCHPLRPAGRCVRLLSFDAAIEPTTAAVDITADGSDGLDTAADDLNEDSQSMYDDYDGALPPVKYVCINCEQAQACTRYDGDTDGDEEVDEELYDGGGRGRGDRTSEENIVAAAAAAAAVAAGKPRLPVCASNNVTYGSWCRMMATACRLRIYLHVVHPGRCSANQSEIETTILQYQRELRRHHVREIGGSSVVSRPAPRAMRPAAPRKRSNAAVGRRHRIA